MATFGPVLIYPNALTPDQLRQLIGSMQGVPPANQRQAIRLKLGGKIVGKGDGDRGALVFLGVDLDVAGEGSYAFEHSAEADAHPAVADFGEIVRGNTFAEIAHFDGHAVRIASQIDLGEF